MEELRNDIKKFTTKAKLREHFSNEEKLEQIATDTSLAKNKGSFNPPRNRNIILNTFCDFKTKFPVQELQTRKKRSNIRSDESTTLTNLRNDKSIIVKQAEKGGAIVFADRQFYSRKMLDILGDEDTYTNLEEHSGEKVMQKIKQLTGKYMKVITKEEKDYLTKFNHHMSTFYGLPKIYKSGAIIRHTQDQKQRI